MAARSMLVPAVFLTLLAGCDTDPLALPPEPPWMNAAQDHICTIEQMRRVETETVFCATKTTLRNSYCYGASIMRNCTRRQELAGGGEVR